MTEEETECEQLHNSVQTQYCHFLAELNTQAVGSMRVKCKKIKTKIHVGKWREPLDWWVWWLMTGKHGWTVFLWRYAMPVVSPGAWSVKLVQTCRVDPELHSSQSTSSLLLLPLQQSAYQPKHTGFKNRWKNNMSLPVKEQTTIRSWEEKGNRRRCWKCCLNTSYCVSV